MKHKLSNMKEKHLKQECKHIIIYIYIFVYIKISCNEFVKMHKNTYIIYIRTRVIKIQKVFIFPSLYTFLHVDKFILSLFNSLHQNLDFQ